MKVKRYSKLAYPCPACDGWHEGVPERLYVYDVSDIDHLPVNPQEYPQGADPPEVVERSLCPEESEWFDPDDVEPGEAWQCGECDGIFADRDEAKECCR